MRIWDWLCRRHVETVDEYLKHGRAAEQNERVDDYEPWRPFNCPRCCGRIELREGTWECMGLVNRTEVEKYLAPWHHGPVPPVVVARPACGWTGRAADHGKTWV